jgi:hypothetical protein
MIELIDVCARMRAHSLDLFELVGGWVTTTGDPVVQRLLATACHQHAWHADLWAQRCPTVPVGDLEPATASDRHPAQQISDSERVSTYRARLEQLVGDMDRLATRFDPDLDPSTARTIDLVRSDLTRIQVGLSAASW